jgi:hypothetical protein
LRWAFLLDLFDEKKNLEVRIYPSITPKNTAGMTIITPLASLHCLATITRFDCSSAHKKTSVRRKRYRSHHHHHHHSLFNLKSTLVARFIVQKQLSPKEPWPLLQTKQTKRKWPLNFRQEELPMVPKTRGVTCPTPSTKNRTAPTRLWIQATQALALVRRLPTSTKTTQQPLPRKRIAMSCDPKFWSLSSSFWQLPW